MKKNKQRSTKHYTKKATISCFTCDTRRVYATRHEHHRLCPWYMATATIPGKNNVRFISNPICFVEDSCIFMLFVFIYTGGQNDFRIRWCSCRTFILKESNNTSTTNNGKKKSTDGYPIMTETHKYASSIPMYKMRYAIRRNKHHKPIVWRY
jgi:hypothetical protein